MPACAAIFAARADPSYSPRDHGRQLAEAPTGQRVRAVGDVFTMTLTMGASAHHIVEFDEGRSIAWRPSERVWNRPVTYGVGGSNPSTTYSRCDPHLRLVPADRRNAIATPRATTADKLQASIDRLAELAERS